jgi:hypothetical protein
VAVEMKGVKSAPSLEGALALRVSPRPYYIHAESHDKIGEAEDVRREADDGKQDAS